MRADKRALKKSVWVSLSKFIGVFMGAGAGSMLHQILGDKMESVAMGFFLAVAGFLLMLYSEYKSRIL